MFTYATTIRLRDTDATGVIYFSEQFRIALEAFEAFLKCKSHSLSLLLSSPYLMPIVHAEGDYMSPLQVDDQIEVVLKFGKVGERSFSVEYEIVKLPERILAGKVRIVHAFIKKGESKATEIPAYFRILTEQAT